MRRRDTHAMLRVEEVVDETPTVRTLVFSDDVMSKALPGQFAMVWVPGKGELPMSIMVAGRGRAAFTVRRHGPASTALYETGRGQLIGVRGPYGNSFEDREGRLLLAGGGTGLVPMMRLLSHVGRRESDLVIGARTAEEVFFADTARELSGGACNVVITTEDGTAGQKGRVTDAVAGLLAGSKYGAAYTCGPELMMHGVVQEARSAGVFVQASLERMMKCGAGICGSCCAGEDLACRDGTVFDGDHLAANPEFGKTYRDKAGTPQSY